MRSTTAILRDAVEKRCGRMREVMPAAGGTRRNPQSVSSTAPALAASHARVHRPDGSADGHRANGTLDGSADGAGAV